MRHVSITHRVALDWLFDRNNLDPKIQIKYIDTKNQLADILTKWNFTRDEWSCGARSIRETWENFLGCDATSCTSSWRTSSRRKCAFRKVRRDDSRWIGETWDSESPRRGKFRKFRHGQWRSRICEQSQRPSAKQTEKNVERCRVRWRAFNNMGNVHGYNVKCGDIHGKEFLNYSKCCQESWRSHIEANVWCHRTIGD